MLEVLFQEPRILAVAILVALAVVALLIIPWFYFFKAWNLRFFPAVGASLFAILAVIYGGMVFTRLALSDGGRGRPPGQAPLEQWLAFAEINAVLAVAAAFPGGILGLVVAWLLGRSTPPQSLADRGSAFEKKRSVRWARSADITNFAPNAGASTVTAVECPSCGEPMEIEENEPNTEWECPTCAAAFLVQRNQDGTLQFFVTEASPDAGHFVVGPSPASSPRFQEPGIPDEVYVEALESLVKGKRPREVRKGLVKAGYSGPQAEQIVQTAFQFQKDKELEEKLMPNSGGRTGQTNMIIGGLVFLVGLVVTLGTMTLASRPRRRQLRHRLGRHRLRGHAIPARVGAIQKFLIIPRGCVQPDTEMIPEVAMVWTLFRGLLANAGILLRATIARLKVDRPTTARLVASSFVLALAFVAAATASHLQAPAPFPAGPLQQGAFAQPQPDDFHGGQALGILSGLGGGLGLFLLVFGCARLAHVPSRPPLDEIDDRDGDESLEGRDIARDQSGL